MTVRVRKRDVTTETEVERCRTMSKGIWQSLEDGKGREIGSALELPEGMWP